MSAVPDLPWSGAEPEPDAGGGKLLGRVLIGLALTWLAVTAWATLAGGGGQALAATLRWAALASGPLALLMLIWLQFTRRGDREEPPPAAVVRDGGVDLEGVLASVAARLEERNGKLGEDAARLMTLGDEAADRLGRVAHYLSKEGAKLEARSQALEAAADRAQQQFEALLADMPKAEERARQVAEVIKEAGLGAHAQAGALEAQLAALSARGREADEVVGGAAQRLGAHLDRVESTTGAATARMGDAADAMAATVDGSMARAAEAVDAARAGLEAQGAAMLAMIDQSRAALGGAGEQAARGLGEQLTGLSAELDRIETRVAALGDGERIETTRASLRTLADDMTAGSEGSALLIERVREVREMLAGMDAGLRQDVPEALDRIGQQAERTRLSLSSIAPDAAGLAQTASEAAKRITEAHALIAREQDGVAAMLARLGDGLGAAEQQVRALAAAAAEADEAAGRISGETGPALIDALVRVRETAAQAADRAREAIAAVIPESAAALGEASRRAVGEAVGDAVARQLVDLEALAERTVEAARRASERLTRQMLTIGETTAAVEERIEEARKASEAKDNESFSRRVALLIESLNSTAIDVTKILSNEVTDSAWAAYLKGDRGVFTRRAVRLIEPAEGREIMAHYESEPEFREQVNRYIHDFEAMLRRVLADRDSAALGVTLLGSDMGKLYVALAQAIERIRS